MEIFAEFLRISFHEFSRAGVFCAKLRENLYTGKLIRIRYRQSSQPQMLLSVGLYFENLKSQIYNQLSYI